MENILLVCPVCRQRELEKLFAPLGATIFIAHGVCEARKNLCDMSFSLVVIESPLADGSARELAVQIINGEARRFQHLLDSDCLIIYDKMLIQHCCGQI